MIFARSARPALRTVFECLDSTVRIVAWLRRPSVSRWQRADAALVSQIQSIYQNSRGIYGAPRIQAELRARGTVAGRHRITRLMSEQGLQGVCRRRNKSLTKRAPDAIISKDLVQRQFRATRPNELWVADATYVPTEEGVLYLGINLDVFARRIVGWSMAARQGSELMVRALQMAGNPTRSCTIPYTCQRSARWHRPLLQRPPHTVLSFLCQSLHNADNVPLRDDPDACVACSYSYNAQFVNWLGPRRRKDHSFMRGRNLGDSATVIVPSLNDAESVTDQANKRVASDTTVETVFNRADSRHDTECSLREYELDQAECWG